MAYLYKINENYTASIELLNIACKISTNNINKNNLIYYNLNDSLIEIYEVLNNATAIDSLRKINNKIKRRNYIDKNLFTVSMFFKVNYWVFLSIIFILLLLYIFYYKYLREKILIISAKKGYLKITKYYTNKGVFNNICDTIKIDIFTQVINKRQTNIFKQIIKNNSSFSDYVKSDILITVIRTQQIDLLKLIINKTSDLYAKDFKKNSILMYAINNRLDNYLIKYFVDKGGNVNLKDKTSKTLLMYIIENKCFDSFNYLIKNGADIDATDKNNKSVFNYALISEQEDFLKLLLNKNINLSSSLIYAVNKGQIHTINYLLKIGADTNSVDNKGKSVLMNVIENVSFFIKIGLPEDAKEQIDFAIILINKGANINYLDTNNKSVLMYAAENNLTNISKIIIDKGANISLRDRNNWSVLMYAHKNKKNIEIIKLLS